MLLIAGLWYVSLGVLTHLLTSDDLRDWLRWVVIALLWPVSVYFYLKYYK